ncbi:hypothetical protein BCR35DRAFT_48368 [Leucosporidium creatinivorum]|uniref:Uncharacterized protein n=1 Tax=Leucosporidium creatinivorum TaxID=106004 RepID=A0A1Y2FPN9_9BASI|nr:hypothetical protein BCR35DRAFT_48368 [Leucosporidium creatinivorum]
MNKRTRWNDSLPLLVRRSRRRHVTRQCTRRLALLQQQQQRKTKSTTPPTPPLNGTSPSPQTTCPPSNGAMVRALRSTSRLHLPAPLPPTLKLRTTPQSVSSTPLSTHHPNSVAPPPPPPPTPTPTAPPSPAPKAHQHTSNSLRSPSLHPLSSVYHLYLRPCRAYSSHWRMRVRRIARLPPSPRRGQQQGQERRSSKCREHRVRDRVLDLALVRLVLNVRTRYRLPPSSPPNRIRTTPPPPSMKRILPSSPIPPRLTIPPSAPAREGEQFSYGSFLPL